MGKTKENEREIENLSDAFVFERNRKREKKVTQSRWIFPFFFFFYRGKINDEID